MEKVKESIKELIETKQIKTKWSELECHGASEFVNLLFQEQVEYGSIAQSIIVEDKIVCMSFFEGVPYQSQEGHETIIRMYIDLEDNILFLSRKDNLYKYETSSMDAADLRHYYGKD